MDQDFCVATVDAVPDASGLYPVAGLLPDSGAGLGPWWLIAALVLLAAGTAVLLLRRRRAATLSAAVLLGAALAVIPGISDEARAQVDYTGACSLIELTDTVLHGGVDNLLPGDSVTAITTTVHNRFDGSIGIEAEALLDDAALAEQVDLTVAIDGEIASVAVLESGESATFTVVVDIGLEIANAAQDLVAPLSLRITATQR